MMEEKKVINFARSESNSSFESESPGAARVNADDADEYESDKYGAFEDGLRSAVNFRPNPPLRSSRSLASSFPLKSSSSVKDCDTGRHGDADGKDDDALCAAVIVYMIDREMKVHASHLLRAAHGISAQITQLETKTRELEDLIGNLKDSTEFYQRRTERRLRDVEDMMTEVHGGIQDLRDKQTIAEVQLQLAKVQQIRADLQSKHQDTGVQNELVQQQVSFVHHLDHQSHPSAAACQLKLSDLPSYCPPISLQNSVQIPANTATEIPQQLGRNKSYFIEQFQTCYRPPLLSPDSAGEQCHMFPTQSSVTQYQPSVHSSFSGSSQLPQPQTPNSTHHSSIYQVNHHPQERPYMPSEDNSIPIPKLSSATGMVSLPKQFHVDFSPNVNKQPLGSSMVTPGHSGQPGNYNLSDQVEGSPVLYWGSTMKTSQPLPTFSPTPKVLPRALPMALDVNEVSRSGGNESSVSIEDIVENAVAMGFRRNAVKATVKNLTDNEQPVDLNLVLDKLINSEELKR